MELCQDHRLVKDGQQTDKVLAWQASSSSLAHRAPADKYHPTQGSINQCTLVQMHWCLHVRTQDRSRRCGCIGND